MNPNLLRITTVPIKIEVSVTKASLESPGKQLPRMNVQTERGGFRMSAKPAKLNIDTYAARSSMGYGNMKTSDIINEEAQRGIKLAYEGTARIVEEGNQLARGASPVDIAVQNQRANFNIQTVMDFLPKTGADITYEDGSLNIHYEIDNTQVDWEHIQASRLVFNPGSVEISVQQYPKVMIEYLGEPIYVPPSANPNYEAQA